MKTCFIIRMVDTYGEEHIAGVTMTEEKAKAKVEEFKKHIRETRLLICAGVLMPKR